MQSAYHYSVAVGEIALVFLIDTLQNLVERTLFLLSRSALLLCGNVLSIEVLKLYRPLKGLLQLVIFELELAFKVNGIGRVFRQQTYKVTQE